MMICLGSSVRSCVNTDVVGNLEGGRSDFLNVVQLYTLCQLNQSHATVDPVDIEHCKIGDDSTDTANSRLRQTAFLDNLGVAVLVEVVGHDNDLSAWLSV